MKNRSFLLRGSVISLAVAMLLSCQSDDCDLDAASQSGYEAAMADELMDGHPVYQALSCEAARTAWKESWKRGQSELCKPGKGWQMANEGQLAYQVCSLLVNQPGSYLATYRLAEQIAALKEEQQTLENKSMQESLSAQEASRLRNVIYEINELNVLAEQWKLTESTAPEPGG